MKTAGNRDDTLPHLVAFPTLVAAVSRSGRGRQGACEPYDEGRACPECCTQTGGLWAEQVSARTASEGLEGDRD